VRNLKPVWTMSTGVVEGHQSPPFVNNGVMFVSTPGNQVLALNAKTGDLIWRYKRELPEDIIQSHPTNAAWRCWAQGLPRDARCVRRRARRENRQGAVGNQSDDYKRAYYFTLAPLVAKAR
jgi:alcohol dehydrogenase (cytochrome c)